MYHLEYLLANSHLPGPRGNLELLYAFTKTADQATVDSCLECIREDAANSPQEFAGMCGVLGYAHLHRDDPPQVFAFLRPFASHASWRIREAVAMAIQEIGVTSVASLGWLGPMRKGNPYEQRAVVAGLCEPKLLVNADIGPAVLEILEEITMGLAHGNPLDSAQEALRKGLGYGWSVAIVAYPTEGKACFERLFTLPGKHIRWIIKENLKKNRLIRLDGAWVASLTQRL